MIKYHDEDYQEEGVTMTNDHRTSSLIQVYNLTAKNVPTFTSLHFSLFLSI